MRVSEIAINKLPTAKLEIRVRITKRFRLRVKVAVFLLKLGAWIMPMSTKVELEVEE